MNELPLADLDAFAAIAREQSFRAAARKRGVSPSALSEALRRLEDRLGVRLLNRTTRSVTPTEAGQRLLDGLAPILGDIGTVIDQVNGFRATPAGTLRLNVPTIIGRIVFPPIATDFLRAYPDIALEVTADDTFIDVLAAGFDAGIRYGESLDRDMIAVPFGPKEQRFVCAAAPAYLAARGTPLHPRDLVGHACLRHRFLSGSAPVWEFQKGEEVVRIMPKGPLTGNVFELQIAAALAGLGIISSFAEHIQPAINNGGLVPLLEDWLEPFPGPFLYYPSRRHMPAPLRAFVDFIKARQKREARSSDAAAMPVGSGC